MNGKHVKSNSISKGKPFYSQQHSHRSQSAMLVNSADDNMNKPSKRDSVAASSIKNITGALVDGHVVNQVMYSVPQSVKDVSHARNDTTLVL